MQPARASGFFLHLNGHILNPQHLSWRTEREEPPKPRYLNAEQQTLDKFFISVNNVAANVVFKSVFVLLPLHILIMKGIYNHNN